MTRGDSANSSPEKSAKSEVKPEASVRSKSSSSTPTSPKPPLQSSKPSLTVRPTVPQKPRSSSRAGKPVTYNKWQTKLSLSYMTGHKTTILLLTHRIMHHLQAMAKKTASPPL